MSNFNTLRNAIKKYKYDEARDIALEEFKAPSLSDDELNILIDEANDMVHFEKERYVETWGDKAGKAVGGFLVTVFTGGLIDGMKNRGKIKRAPRALNDTVFILHLQKAKKEMDYNALYQLSNTNRELFLELFTFEDLLKDNFFDDENYKFIQLMKLYQEDYKSSRGDSPLIWAIKKKKWNIVENILRNLDDASKLAILINSDHKMNVLNELTQHKHQEHLYLLQYLFATPRAYYFLSNQSHICNRLTNTELGRALLATAVNHQRHYGHEPQWPILYAAGEDNWNAVRLAFEHGASLNKRTVHWIDNEVWEFSDNDDQCLLNDLDNEPEIQNRLVEEAIRYWCSVEEKDDVHKRILKPIVHSYLDSGEERTALKDRIAVIRKSDDPVSVENLNEFVAAANKEIAQPILEKTQALKNKAIWLTVFSFLIVPLFFAIKYWKMYLSTCDDAPLHIYDLPQNLYLKLKGHDNMRESDESQEEQADRIISKNDRIKRSVLEQDEAAQYTKLFERDDNPRKRIRVVCAEGQQTARFEEKINENLSIIERASVSRVL